MEETVKSILDYASAFIVESWVGLIAFGVMLALWRWWMGHKLDDRITDLEAEHDDRITDLEAEHRSSGISQVLIVHGDLIHNAGNQLRAAIEEAKTSQNMRETIRRLPQMPLGDDHTYARLPDGTNIVTMADGTMQLAIPKSLSATASLDPITTSATMHKRPVGMEEEP